YSVIINPIMEHSKHVMDNGTELYVVSSPRYSNTTINFGFYARNSSQNSARRAAISLLGEGCKKYPTSQQINLAAEQEYGAAIGAFSTTHGDLHINGISLNVLSNYKFTDGRKTLENMVSLLSEMLYYPLILSGKFNETYFQTEKTSLLNQAKSRDIDKNAIASNRLNRLALGKDSIFAMDEIGSTEQLVALENMQAVWAFQDMYERDARKLFITTNYSPEDMIALMKLNFSNLPKVDSAIFIGEPPEKKGAGMMLEDKSSFDQTMIGMAFPVLKPQNVKEIRALYILNHHIGGYSNARLFTEIRTKRDMAYGAYSHIDFDTGMIIGNTSVDEKNKDTAKRIMLDEFFKAASGRITKKGFKEAKAHLINSRAMNIHKKNNIIATIKTSVLKNLPEILENYENAFDSISYEDVLEAAKHVQETPIIYCLLQKEKK
ncbi:MAG: insulinase family protein, partial [Nanoarchaeota archaeon]